MADALGYGELLTRVFRRIAREQGTNRHVRVRSVCDVEAGQFLVVATGWVREAGRLIWQDAILVDAWLEDGKVVVVENNMECLLEMLVEVGVAQEDVVDVEEIEALEVVGV